MIVNAMRHLTAKGGSGRGRVELQRSVDRNRYGAGPVETLFGHSDLRPFLSLAFGNPSPATASLHPERKHTFINNDRVFARCCNGHPVLLSFKEALTVPPRAEPVETIHERCLLPAQSQGINVLADCIYEVDVGRAVSG